MWLFSAKPIYIAESKAWWKAPYNYQSGNALNLKICKIIPLHIVCDVH